MGTIFNIVGCECNKESNNNNNKLKIYNSVKPVRVSDYSSTEMICSMIIPREIYIDQPKKSFSSTDLVKKIMIIRRKYLRNIQKYVF